MKASRSPWAKTNLEPGFKVSQHEKLQSTNEQSRFELN